jgi:hypothetical protein
MAKKKTESQDDDSNPQRRLGLTFHRTFSLIRPALTQVLQLAAGTNRAEGEIEGIERRMLRDLTNLGTIYVEAIPRYCYGSGLLNRQYALTAFGKFAHQHDSLLEQEGTQWLIHYHLSAPQGPGPAFWHELVNTRFRIGDEFTTDDIAAQVSSFFKGNEGEDLADRSARSTATIFLGTYTKSDGLGNLKILEILGENHFRVNDSFSQPPVWAIAYGLLDFWQTQFPNHTTINLNDLYGEEGLTNLFMISRGRLNTVLEEMQQEGILELYRIAPPYQVVLLRRQMQPILEKLYGIKSS